VICHIDTLVEQWWLEELLITFFLPFFNQDLALRGIIKYPIYIRESHHIRYIFSDCKVIAYIILLNDLKFTHSAFHYLQILGLLVDADKFFSIIKSDFDHSKCLVCFVYLIYWLLWVWFDRNADSLDDLAIVLPKINVGLVLFGNKLQDIMLFKGFFNSEEIDVRL